MRPTPEQTFNEQVFKDLIMAIVGLGANSLGLPTDRMKTLLAEILSDEMHWNHLEEVFAKLNDFVRNELKDVGT